MNKHFMVPVLAGAMLSAMCLYTIPAQAADTVVYDAADFENMAGRTEEEVKEKYLEALSTGDTYINGSSDSYYITPASTSAPYAAGVLSGDTLKNMEAMSNFYRWLIGEEPLTVNSTSNAAMQAQAFDRNFEFNHVISDSSKPDDMDQDLWDEGYTCTHNILAWGYTPAGAVTGWLNEGYSLSQSSWGTIGHRVAILHPNYSSITYGYSGTIAIGKCGSAGNTFTNAFAAFPSSYVPSNLISKYSAVWDCRLNTSKVKASDASAVTVTVTDVTTGESYVCTDANDYASVSTGFIAFRQPSATTSSYTDTYRVDITGLTDVATGNAASVTYTVDFFTTGNTLYSSCLTLEREKYAYTGSEIKPGFTVKYSGTTLTEGTDYEVSYINNTDIGTGIVCITGKGDYFGVVKKAFTIRENKKILDECDVTVAACSYTGSALTPAVTVTNYGDTLTEGTDYTVKYSNNINPGTGTVTLTGKGNYSGSQTKEFTISKASQTMTVSRNLYTIEVGGTDKITVSGIGDITFKSGDESILTVDSDGTVHAVADGRTYIYVRASGNDFYSASTNYIYFTASSDTHTMVDTNVVYANGSDNSATVTKKCSVCGKTETSTFTTMTSFYLWWWTGNTGYSYVIKNQTEGTTLHVSLRSYEPPDVENKELLVTSSDESVATVDGLYWTFIDTGTVTITVSAKYNPSVKTSVTFTVSHNLGEGTVVTEATCVKKLQTSYTCAYCGDTVIVDGELDSTNHAGKTYVKNASAATCGKAGYTGDTYCSDCNALLSSGTEIPATGKHTAVTDKAVAATCTTAGETEGSHCSVCGTVIKAQTTVAAKGHTVVTDAAVAATCTTAGKTEGSHCSACNTVIKAQTTVAAKGHTVVTDAAVAATCTTAGKTAGSHCSVCNTVIKAQTTVAAKGHTVVTDAAVAATCTTAGKTAGSHCSVCGTVIKAQTTVAAKGHTAVADAAVAATCTTTGLTAGSHCSVCNTVIKAQTVVAAKGHTMVTDKAVAATCTETGLTEGSHCSVCNTVIKAQEVVPAGHTVVVDPYVAPTFTSTGLTEGSHCSVCNTVIKVQKVIPVVSAGVTYQTHVQNIGWQGLVSDGEMTGTSGLAYRLEGIKISLTGLEGISGSIEYRTQVQGLDWMDWVKDGAMSGTSGQSKRLEAIQIKLSGDVADYYDVYYRVHAQNYGWLGWAKNGESAGTWGYNYRLEALQIVLVPKDSDLDTNLNGIKSININSYISKNGNVKSSLCPGVSYQTQVQNVGWQSTVSNGASAGTVGSSRRLEAIKISLNDNSNLSGSIQYRTHIQNIGWESIWKQDGALSGTVGKALRLEAIQIKLTGEMAEQYDVYYRVHAQNFGWLGWVKNGESAGTAGYAYRLEAIQIVLVPKGGNAPGSTANAFRKK